MTMSRNTAAARTGVHVEAGRVSGCDSCGHPFTLHSSGRTPCRAAGCKSGPAVPCPECQGTTVSLVTGGECGTCRARGTVPGACAGFAHGQHQAAELLAS